jgi:predicted ATPase/DNA-binding CsgD family transcriptional regulator
VTVLIGREKEVAEIHQLLAEPQCRLLTLVGPGGIGKTQLALEVATHLTGFADGIFFVALQPVVSSDHLVPAIATVTGLPLTGNDSLPTQLLRKLRPKQLVLILDNFEHLLAGAELLVDLLHDAPGVKLLVTSRERIGVREEWLYPVHGLTVPAQGTVSDLTTHGAPQLFSARARQVRHDFRWEQERDAVISICRQVEGNPLAVELAASWLAVLPCSAIATQIRQGYDILASPLRNFPERHRSMHAVFDHSWQLLGQAERDIFGRLTVFRGGFTLEAAQAVAGASLADLSALAYKSLIHHQSDGRYQIHELLRQYGAEKLAASPAQVTEVYASFADYFLTFLSVRRPQFDGPSQLRVVLEIEEEYENVYAALRWATGHIQSEIQAEALRRAISPLTNFYQIRGRYLEGAENLADTIRQLEKDVRVDLCGGILAAGLTFLGWLAIRLGRFTEAKEALTRALHLYDELNLPPPEYPTSHPRMAFLFLTLVLGEFEQASVLGRQLCLQAQHDNQPGALALAAYGSASAAMAQGDYEQARHLGEQALSLTERLDIQFLRTSVHDVLGQIACIRGELQAAKRHFQAAYAICVAYKAEGSMAVHLKNLGDVALRQQLWSDARTLYEQSLERYRSLGDLGGSAAAERGLGITACSMGDLNRAYRHFRQALAIAVTTQSLRSILSVVAGVGSFMITQEEGSRRQRLGHQVLSFVTCHPSCDRVTYEEAMESLKRSDAPALGETADTLEGLVATLKAELVDAAETNFAFPASPTHDNVLVEPLTSREAEVLRLLVKGRSNGEIACELGVAVGTVKTHTSNIYRKLDVVNRTQAVARVHELGFLA